jgi:endonuclease G
MKISRLFLFFIIAPIFCSTAMTQQTNLKESAPRHLVGGWYPVFFDDYDQDRVDSIINTINENRVKRIVVTYDKNTALAKKIISNIQSKVNFVIEINHNVPPDTATTKYSHSRVIVTVFLKNNDGSN